MIVIQAVHYKTWPQQATNRKQNVSDNNNNNHNKTEVLKSSTNK